MRRINPAWAGLRRFYREPYCRAITQAMKLILISGCFMNPCIS